MLSITVVLLVKRFLWNLITIGTPSPITPTGHYCKKTPLKYLIRNFFFRKLKCKLLKTYLILEIQLGIFDNVKNVKLLFYCSFLLTLNMFFVLNYIFQICELGETLCFIVHRLLRCYIFRPSVFSQYLFQASVFSQYLFQE